MDIHCTQAYTEAHKRTHAMIPAGHWSCGLCTSNNPNVNTFCAVCHSIHGEVYTSVPSNFSRSSLILAPSSIFPWLYLGSEEATLITHPSQGWAQLFTTVVACMNHPPHGWGHQLAGHHHIVLPLSGGLGGSITSKDYGHYLNTFTPAFQALDDARENGGCVYVHCQHGMSRSVGVVAAYLLTRYPTGALFEMLLPLLALGANPDDLSQQLNADPLTVIMKLLKKRREVSKNCSSNFTAALKKLSLLVMEQNEDGIVPEDGHIGECNIA